MAIQPKQSRIDAAVSSLDSITVCRKTIFWWLPTLYLLISSAFYLRTYDSAQVKITLVQMGGLCLLTLWVCRLIEEGLTAFSKDDLVCLAPFLAYLGYGIYSFIHAPYHWSSTDFFIRRLFYMTAALIVIQEFNEKAIARLTRFLIWSTWITVGYGFLQWVDFHFFPSGIGQGIDPFIWRGAFGDRVFSTYGNPNFFADYLVIMFPILVCQYLKTREIHLLVLLALDLFDLYGSQTKGAWIGLAISLAFLVSTHFYFLEREKLRQFRVQIGGALAVVMMLVFGAIGHKLYKYGFTSVNFRLFTWEATWEMIMTQPVRGTGIGSFWVVYPAFRRPPIFHIEGKHNTETDHSEDEYLEVLMDEGIIGFGIFIWLILSTWVVAYRSLGQMTGSLKKGERAPPRVYELMGYLVAFQGMLVHNFFDVSMRFVSSGVYVGLLSGMVVNLSRGVALSELHNKRDANAPNTPVTETGPSLWESLSSFLIWPMRLAAWGCLVYMACHITGLPRLNNLASGFDELQGPLFRLTLGGEILQWWIAWACFLGCVVGLGIAFMRIVYLTRNPIVPLVICLMMYPLNIVWGFFRADVYHNIAIFHSKSQNWEEALRHYFMVGELNPAYVMSFYFKGNVFNDRFNMQKVYNPKWGDKNNVARDDFERALEAYEQVRSRAPNYVQMHHQVGALYMKLGDYYFGQAGRIDECGKMPPAQFQKEDKCRDIAEQLKSPQGKGQLVLMSQKFNQLGQQAWDEALHRFQMYRNIDPVFPPNYFRMAHIYMMRHDYDKAAEIYRALIEARECAVKPSLLNKDWLRGTILAYQEYTQRDGQWIHLHESGDAYASLGNAFFMKGDLVNAEKAYKDALRKEPGNQNTQRNLQALYQKAQSLGRLRTIQPVAVPGMPATPPSFELVPYKK